MALSDIYQLILTQDYGGKVIQNIFSFEKLTPAGTSDDLIDGFTDNYLPAIRLIQAQDIQTSGLSAYNLGDLSDFGELPLSVPGLGGSGDMLPSFNAVGFTLNANTRAVRPGSKRFAGILEAVVTRGTVTDPTYISNLEALRIVLDDNVTGTLANYQPVVVKRIKTPVPGTTPVQYKYLLPKPGDTLVLGLVKSAAVSLRITSQVSRKKAS